MKAGSDVTCLVRYNALQSIGWLSNSDVHKHVQIFQGNIEDRDCLQKCMKGTQLVFHLAALIGIPYSYVAPASYINTNVVGTLNVLQSALNQNVEKVIHTSTSEVYGTADYVPIDENHPLKGQSPYSASKIGADKLAESFHYSFGLPVTIVRPFNTFGPRQSARAVVPTIITQCLAADKVRLGSLHPTRDLTYVTDTVSGFIHAAESEQAVGKTINLGTGREISIGDLANLIITRIGAEATIVSVEDRKRPDSSEVGRLLSNNELAKSLVNWQPQVSLEQGLDHTMAWIQENIEHYKVDQYST